MKTANINGLTQEDIVLLYSYVNAYESHIRVLKDKEKICEQEKQLKEKTKTITYKCCYQIELKDCNITEINNEIYFTDSKSNKTLSFLWHLRNSIAHCSIVKKGNQYELIDKYHNKPNMKGRVDCNILEDIINIFI